MDLEITTRKSVKKAAIKACAEWLINDLNLNMNKGLVHIILEETKDMGQVSEVSEGYYVIVLSKKLSLSNTLQALCHEMVHVYQMAKGLFKQHEYHYSWVGKHYPADYPYYDRPWEIQAFEKEVLLFRRATEYFAQMNQK